LKEKVVAPILKSEINGRRIRCADVATPLYRQNLLLTSLTSDDILRLRTKSHRVCFLFVVKHYRERELEVYNNIGPRVRIAISGEGLKKTIP
jgi:hypothetical protein